MMFRTLLYAVLPRKVERTPCVPQGIITCKNCGAKDTQPWVKHLKRNTDLYLCRPCYYEGWIHVEAKR